MEVIWLGREAKYFCGEGWTGAKSADGANYRDSAGCAVATACVLPGATSQLMHC
jgi:hypothetical protein